MNLACHQQREPHLSNWGQIETLYQETSRAAFTTEMETGSCISQQSTKATSLRYRIVSTRKQPKPQESNCCIRCGHTKVQGSFQRMRRVKKASQVPIHGDRAALLQELNVV